jgi:hypothetical protein
MGHNVNTQPNVVRETSPVLVLNVNTHLDAVNGIE